MGLATYSPRARSTSQRLWIQHSGPWFWWHSVEGSRRCATLWCHLGLWSGEAAEGFHCAMLQQREWQWWLHPNANTPAAWTGLFCTLPSHWKTLLIPDHNLCCNLHWCRFTCDFSRVIFITLDSSQLDQCRAVRRVPPFLYNSRKADNTGIKMCHVPKPFDYKQFEGGVQFMFSAYTMGSQSRTTIPRHHDNANTNTKMKDFFIITMASTRQKINSALNLYPNLYLDLKSRLPNK